MLLYMPEMSSPRAHAILESLLDVVARRGLERVTVREVAASAGVAIGTVQHYFPTKDAMVVAAFTEVVRRIRARVDGTPLGPDAYRNLRAVLHELLPLDERRQNEARIQVAFAAKAATSPTLAGLQRQVLGEVREAIGEVFALIWPGSAAGDAVELSAAATLAVVDGLALHAVSADDVADPGLMIRVLDLFRQPGVTRRPPPAMGRR